MVVDLGGLGFGYGVQCFGGGFDDGQCAELVVGEGVDAVEAVGEDVAEHLFEIGGGCLEAVGELVGSVGFACLEDVGNLGVEIGGFEPSPRGLGLRLDGVRDGGLVGGVVPDVYNFDGVSAAGWRNLDVGAGRSSERPPVVGGGGAGCPSVHFGSSFGGWCWWDRSRSGWGVNSSWAPRGW